MKNNLSLSFKKVILLFAAFLIGVVANAQFSPKEKKIIEDSKLAKSAFIKADESMKDMFKNA